MSGRVKKTWGGTRSRKKKKKTFSGKGKKKGGEPDLANPCGKDFCDSVVKFSGRSDCERREGWRCWVQIIFIHISKRKEYIDEDNDHENYFHTGKRFKKKN